MEAIRFIFEIAKQVYGPNSMKIMLVDERKTANQAHGPMNINIADSLFTFLMQADLEHPILHVLRSSISSVYSATRDGSAFCIIFLYLLIRSANKASLNYASEFDLQDLNLPPHLVPLMDVYQSVMKPELDQLTMDLPLDAKENIHQLIYSVLNTKLDDRTSQELSSGLSTFIALNNNKTYSAYNNNLFTLHSLPQLHESVTKESIGLHHMIVKGLILPINAVNAKIGLKLVNPKTLILHASLESKLANNNKRGPKVSYSTAEERISIEEEDKKILMAATMKVIESGVSILFITQSIGPVALQLLTTYGVLVFQVNEVMVSHIKKYITIEEYWDCDSIKPVNEPQEQISNVTTHYGPFAPILVDNSTSINREEQWALIFINNNTNDKSSNPMPSNLLLKGLGISDLAKQVLALVANSVSTSGADTTTSLKLLRGAGQWMIGLIRKLKMASNAITDVGYVRAIEVIIEALSGVHHQLVHNIRTHTNQFEENLDRPVIVDSYFAVEKTLGTTLELAQVLMRIDQIIKPQIIPFEFLQESINKQNLKANTEGQQESNLYREEEQHAKETMRSGSKTSAVMEQERERIKRQREENDRQHQTRVFKLEQLLHEQYGDQFSANK